MTLDYEAEGRLYDLYAETDKARLAAQRDAEKHARAAGTWEGVADVLAAALIKNGVGGKVFDEALSLYYGLGGTVGKQEGT